MVGLNLLMKIFTTMMKFLKNYPEKYGGQSEMAQKLNY